MSSAYFHDARVITLGYVLSIHTLPGFGNHSIEEMSIGSVLRSYLTDFAYSIDGQAPIISSPNSLKIPVTVFLVG